MSLYLRRRLLLTVPVLLGVSTLVFLFVHLIPGDPVEVMLGEQALATDKEALRRNLGLDRPLHLQYVGFIKGLLTGTLGRSLFTDEPVGETLLRHLGPTALLAGASLLIALAFALPLGILAALRQGSLLDRGAILLALTGVAIPNFVLGPLLILAFSIGLGWTPVSGAEGPSHLILPALTLGTAMAGILSRMIRSSLLETLGEEYLRTARAKGLPERAVILRHALRTSLIPVITVVGLQAGGLLSGALITETIFAWPGLGRLTIQAINSRDYPLVQGAVLFIALGYVAVNLVTDLLYARADPRIRLR